jgi:hypothetical protein
MDIRRRYPRIPSENTILLKKLGPAEMESFAKTQIVGLGGCMFVSDELYGTGTYFDLLISVKNTVVKAMGKVVYEVPDADGKFQIGCEFIHISDSDRQILEVLWK